MSRKDIEYIKVNKKNYIKTATQNLSKVRFGHRHLLKEEICFAGLSKDLARYPKQGDVQYILKWEPKDTFIDYEALMKELKQIFKYQVSIIRYVSGVKNVRIIDVRTKHKFADHNIKFFFFNILFCMLRGIDGEGRGKIKAYFGPESRPDKDKMEEYNLPFNNWYNFLYFWHKHCNQTGHGINDNISYLRPNYNAPFEYDGNGNQIQHNNKPGKDALYSASIHNFLNTLSTLFGNKFEWKDDVIKDAISSVMDNHHYGFYEDDKGIIQAGQTPSFSVLEYIAKEGKKDEQKG